MVSAVPLVTINLLTYKSGHVAYNVDVCLFVRCASFTRLNNDDCRRAPYYCWTGGDGNAVYTHVFTCRPMEATTFIFVFIATSLALTRFSCSLSVAATVVYKSCTVCITERLQPPEKSSFVYRVTIIRLQIL